MAGRILDSMRTSGIIIRVSGLVIGVRYDLAFEVIMDVAQEASP